MHGHADGDEMFPSKPRRPKKKNRRFRAGTKNGSDQILSSLRAQMIGGDRVTWNHLPKDFFLTRAKVAKSWLKCP